MKILIKKILILAIMVIAINQVSAGVFNDTICAGSQITIGNVYPSATLYQWNTTPPQYTPTITVSPTVNTSYIVNVFVGTNWLLADTFNIAVKPLPNGSVNPPNQTICAGGSATITASGGVSYLWIPGGMTTASVTVSPSSTTVYSVVITGSNGCSVTLSSTVTVNPVPIISNIGSNSPVCEGSNLNLTATADPGSSYLWTGPNGFNSNLQNPVIANASITNAGTYLCFATLNGCISNAASTVVIVNPTPTIAISSNSPICEGSVLNLTATATLGSIYAWTGPNGFSSNLQNPTITNVSNINAGSYSCIVTLNGCSSDTASTVVVVNAVPVITYIGSNSPVCSGNSITLNITATQGSSYAWTGPNGFVSNLQNPVIPNVTAANSGNYTCLVSLGGCSTSANTAVIVNETPIINAIGNNSPLCEGSNLTLYATANQGSSYYWTGPNGFTSTLQNPIIANATVTNSGTYNVTATLNGCATSANTNVTVNASPIATITGNLNICYGQSTTLTAGGGTSYLWSNGATTASITVNPTVTTTYSVIVTANGGCFATAFATVVVNSLPTITISASANNICEGEEVVLIAGGASAYIWNTGATTTTIVVSPTVTTTYTVTGTNTSGCSNTANITVVVNPSPLVIFNLPQEQICVDANPLTLTGGTPAGGTYYGEGIHNGLFYPSTVGVGTYEIYYEYTNSFGCSGITRQLLAVNPLPTVIFNSIFPNPVDLDAAAFQLNTGIPLGGTYSGPGVVNGWFHPSIAGAGIHTINYTYVDFMSCSNTMMQTVTVVEGLGVEEQNSSSLIRIYPNPASDILNIEMAEIPDLVQVVDMTGKVIVTNKVDNEKFGLDVKHLSKGIYLLRFTYKSGSMGTVRFIK